MMYLGLFCLRYGLVWWPRLASNFVVQASPRSFSLGLLNSGITSWFLTNANSPFLISGILRFLHGVFHLIKKKNLRTDSRGSQRTVLLVFQRKPPDRQGVDLGSRPEGNRKERENKKQLLLTQHKVLPHWRQAATQRGPGC